jgi:RimJ/RimL family protein N-acetyltransferase
MPLPIETQRLIVRKYEDHDLPDIVEYSSSKNYWLLRNLDWNPNEENAKRYWETQRNIRFEDDPRWLSLVIELKGDNKVIGNTGLGVVFSEGQKQSTIGWLIGENFQGKGYATEAARGLISYGFKELGLHRITARTGLDNVRSWRVMQRLGMRQEARFKESHIVKGEWRDEVVYAILAEEWWRKEDG